MLTIRRGTHNPIARHSAPSLALSAQPSPRRCGSRFENSNSSQDRPRCQPAALDWAISRGVPMGMVSKGSPSRRRRTWSGVNRTPLIPTGPWSSASSLCSHADRRRRRFCPQTWKTAPASSSSRCAPAPCSENSLFPAPGDDGKIAMEMRHIKRPWKAKVWMPDSRYRQCDRY